MNKCDPLSQEDVPQKRQCAEDSWQYTLVVERLHWNVVNLKHGHQHLVRESLMHNILQQSGLSLSQELGHFYFHQDFVDKYTNEIGVPSPLLMIS